MSPSALGPYQITGELGSGGMGTVYLARHRDSGEQVALKVLAASMSREPGFVARFHREIEVLQQLSSPYVVKLLDHGVDGETYYFAMEYVDGETLTDRLEREKRIPWRRAIEIGVQICRALKSAHNTGVVHRDLKPSNLLLTTNGDVKLTDFGVAQLFASSRLTATGGMIGTAEYMSPEQAAGKRVGKASDIYSLGAVMYVMLTGRPPFTGKSTVDILQQHRFGLFDSPRRFNPEIPRWLDEVVCQCLEKEPEKRFPDAYVLELRLAEIPKKVDLANGPSAAADGLPVDADAETIAPAEIAAPQPQREIGATFVRDLMRAELDVAARGTPVERWLDNIWVLIALLVAVVTIGVWMFINRRPDPERMFAAGEALMSEPRGSAWVQAGRDYFAPLVALDRETWEPRVAPYQMRIELADLELDLKRQARRNGNTEARSPSRCRCWSRVQRDLANGDVRTARSRLQGLLVLLQVAPPADQPAAEVETVRSIAQSLLDTLPAESEFNDEATLAAAFERAGTGGGERPRRSDSDSRRPASRVH
ncbi:MAG: serine/threonine-protein kinase [Planctomycetaceae bacterium]